MNMKLSRDLIFLTVTILLSTIVTSEDPYRYFTWTVTYGTASPLGIRQQVILINGQFPGPTLDCVTNDNIILNVTNKLNEPFLITWNGIKQRKNSWEDGVLGTNCPIPTNGSYTYKFQTKDQIGSYTYFPSTGMHKAAGGFGGLNVYSRPRIPVPYSTPDGDFTLLIGDWYTYNYKTLQERLDSGKAMPYPSGLLINGQTNSIFIGDQGKTYKFRVSNVGISTTFNFRIQGHKLKVVEVEGANVIQTEYESVDVHVGQSLSILVTLDQSPKDYYIVASTRFAKPEFTVKGALHYSTSMTQVSGPLPPPPAGQMHWSMQQARTFRRNLTSNAARPNPQGSYHYGTIPITSSFIFANSAPKIEGKQRYAVNEVSFVYPETPLKLADYLNISGVFNLNTIQTSPSNGANFRNGTSVIGTNLHDFIEIVFQNNEKTMQSWHLDGYDFWVVGFGSDKWTPENRKGYNLLDAVTRHTTQVYPESWTAVLASLDNQGMWNLRSSMWERQYLGQQLYLRVWNSVKSFSNEYDPPTNMLLCGKAAL